MQSNCKYKLIRKKSVAFKSESPKTNIPVNKSDSNLDINKNIFNILDDHLNKVTSKKISGSLLKKKEGVEVNEDANKIIESEYKKESNVHLKPRQLKKLNKVVSFILC